MNNVRPQLEELLLWSVENMSVESVDVADAVVRVQARSTARRAACPGCECWVESNTRLLPAVSL
ncbi:hypothetical protein GCM10010393_15960 [Streptomyces gobitricini]|uniref:Transposase IS204/IS1001/IS1096/IS1165 zinc-finger domain-containing protein n=1 Tax=Streptomyces gobitricini TaxID=68211 RepID=A0ABP5YR94_9ACTN